MFSIEVTSSNSSTNKLQSSISSTFTETTQLQLSKLTGNETGNINVTQSTAATQLNGGNVSTTTILTSPINYQTALSTYVAVPNVPSSLLTPLLHTTTSSITRQTPSQVHGYHKVHTYARTQEDIIAISILLGICGLSILLPILLIFSSLLVRFPNWDLVMLFCLWCAVCSVQCAVCSV